MKNKRKETKKNGPKADDTCKIRRKWKNTRWKASHVLLIPDAVSPGVCHGEIETNQ